MAQTISNLNGVRNYFGPQDSKDAKFPSKATKLKTETFAVDFRFDGLPVGSIVDEGVLVIPKGSLFVSCRVQALEAFVGGTGYDIGTVSAVDGTTPISAAGFFAQASTGAIAGINAVGKWIVSAGALVGAVSSLTLDSQLAVVATGTFTAGRARLIIEYIPAQASL